MTGMSILVRWTACGISCGAFPGSGVSRLKIELCLRITGGCWCRPFSSYAEGSEISTGVFMKAPGVGGKALPPGVLKSVKFVLSLALKFLRSGDAEDPAWEEGTDGALNGAS